MPVHFPDDATSDAERRVIHFRNLAFGQGWTRYLPPSAILFFTALASEEQLSRAALEEWISVGNERRERGLDAPAWDPIKVWTAEEWKDFQEDDWGLLSIDRPERIDDVNEANANEVRMHEEELARIDTYTYSLGLEPVRTLGQLLDYMVACGVVVERPDEVLEPVYELNAAADLPSEVLPLAEEDRRSEDALRWHDVHDRTAQHLIRMFRPNDEMIEKLTTTLARLARQLDVDFESVRAAINVLLDEGDFITTADIDSTGPHTTFDLIVDWERFHATRLSFQIAGGNGDDDSKPAD